MYLEYTIFLKNVYFEYTFSRYWVFESEASCDTSLSIPALEGASEFPSHPSTSVAPTTATKMTPAPNENEPPLQHRRYSPPTTATWKGIIARG